MSLSASHLPEVTGGYLLDPSSVSISRSSSGWQKNTTDNRASSRYCRSGSTTLCFCKMTGIGVVFSHPHQHGNKIRSAETHGSTERNLSDAHIYLSGDNRTVEPAHWQMKMCWASPEWIKLRETTFSGLDSVTWLTNGWQVDSVRNYALVVWKL